MESVIRKVHSRGFSVKNIFIYENLVVFIDCGALMLYVPSRIKLCPPETSNVTHAEPFDTDETIQRGEFDQALRIIQRHGEIEDVTITKGPLMFTGTRKRCWKSNKRFTLQAKIAVDLDVFLKKGAVYRKSKITDLQIQVLTALPVPPDLVDKQNEYINLATEVMNEAKSISQTIMESRREVKLLREKSRQNASFVSLDIQLAHQIAQEEKKVRKGQVDYQETKNLLKKILVNFSKFALTAELAQQSITDAMSKIESAKKMLTAYT
jgi:hypothetical protein